MLYSHRQADRHDRIDALCERARPDELSAPRHASDDGGGRGGSGAASPLGGGNHLRGYGGGLLTGGGGGGGGLVLGAPSGLSGAMDAPRGATL